MKQKTFELRDSNLCEWCNRTWPSRRSRARHQRWCSARKDGRTKQIDIRVYRR